VGTQRPFVQLSRSLPTDAASRDPVIQATTELAFGAPVISTSEGVTRVLAKDGQTIVLGGLRDQQSDMNSGGVPILTIAKRRRSSRSCWTFSRNAFAFDAPA